MAIWDDIGSFIGDTNWGDVARFAPAAVGTAGQILQMVDTGRDRNQQSAQYDQQKARYDQAQQQYQQQMAVYQQLLQQYQLQQQQQQQQFTQQQAQAEQERQAQQAYYTQQQQYAQKMQDPAQVAAGAQALYQPLSDLARQQISRDAQAEMAMRGVADGQHANYMSAKAFAPYEAQAMQAAVQQWMASQQQGQAALQKPGYTGAPNAPQAAGSGVQFPTIPQGPRYDIMPAYGGGPQDWSKLTENVTKLLGLRSGEGARTPSIVANPNQYSAPIGPDAGPYTDWPTYQGEGDPF